MIKLNHYYSERGIQKYMGFYLSEHTREIELERKKNSRVNFGLEIMTTKEISEIIEIALIKDLPVIIQPNIKAIDGRGFDDNIIGKIVGFNGDLLYVGNLCISINLIRHITISESTKWYVRDEA
ncbi:MAG: hypothetical protein RR470_01605 [Vagococcus sp.]|uniref:hypothetical protein n=1 Tax=Vagococcus sp. TaxID=1933889 RepID=UPI002FC97A60